MLRHAVDRVGIDAALVAEIQLHDAAPSAEPHAALDEEAELRATSGDCLVHAKQLCTPVPENADPRRHGMADERVQLAEPRVVHERMLNGVAAVGLDIDRR